MSGVERDFMNTSLHPGRAASTAQARRLSRLTTASQAAAPPRRQHDPYCELPTRSRHPGCFPPSSIFTANDNLLRGYADLYQRRSRSRNSGRPSCAASLALEREQHGVSPNTSYAQQHGHRPRIAPSPEGGLTMYPTSPFYPGQRHHADYQSGAGSRRRPISVGWRTTVLGPRQGEQENDTQRFVARARGLRSPAGIIKRRAVV